MNTLPSFSTASGTQLKWQYVGTLPLQGRYSLQELRPGQTISQTQEYDVEAGYTMPHGWKAAVFAQFLPASAILDETKAQREVRVQLTAPGMIAVVAVPGITSHASGGKNAAVPDLPVLNPLLTYTDLTVFDGIVAGGGEPEDTNGLAQQSDAVELEEVSEAEPSDAPLIQDEAAAHGLQPPLAAAAAAAPPAESQFIQAWKTALVDHIASQTQVPQPLFKGLLCKANFYQIASRLAIPTTPWSEALAVQSVESYLEDVNMQDNLSESDVSMCSEFIHVYNTLEQHMVIMQAARGYTTGLLQYSPITLERLVQLWHMRAFPGANAPAAVRWSSPVVVLAIKEWLAKFQDRCAQLGEGARATRLSDIRDHVFLAWSTVARVGKNFHVPYMYLYHAYSALERVFTPTELRDCVIDPSLDLTKTWASMVQPQFGIFATDFEWPRDTRAPGLSNTDPAAPPPIEYWKYVRHVTRALDGVSKARGRHPRVVHAYKHPWLWWSQRQHWTAQTPFDPCVPFLLWQLKMHLPQHSATVDVPTVVLPVSQSGWESMARLLWYMWAVEKIAVVTPDTPSRMWTPGINDSEHAVLDKTVENQSEAVLAPQLLHWIRGCPRATFVQRDHMVALLSLVRFAAAALLIHPKVMLVRTSFMHPSDWDRRVSAPRKWPVLPAENGDDYAFSEQMFGERARPTDVIVGAIASPDLRGSSVPLESLVRLAKTVISVFEAALEDPTAATRSAGNRTLVILMRPFWMGYDGASWDSSFLFRLCGNRSPCYMPPGVTFAPAAAVPRREFNVPVIVPPAVFSVYDYFSRCQLALAVQMATSAQQQNERARFTHRFWQTVFSEMPWPVLLKPVTDASTAAATSIGLSQTRQAAGTSAGGVFEHIVQSPFIPAPGSTTSSPAVFLYDLTVDEPVHPLCLVNAMMEGAPHAEIGKVKVVIKVRATPSTQANTGTCLLRSLVNTWFPPEPVA